MSKLEYVQAIRQIVHRCEHEDRDGAIEQFEALQKQLDQCDVDIREVDRDVLSLNLDTQFMLHEDSVSPDDIRAYINHMNVRQE